MRNYWKDVEEILKQNYLYHLKLDIQLPKEAIKEAQMVYDEKFFVPHRGKKHKGWQSTCIHGIDGMFFKTMSGKQYGFESDSDKNIRWFYTDVINYAPKTTEFFQKEIPLKNYRRLRYMLLEPEGFILEHSDAPSGKPYTTPKRESIFSALNICITQPKDCALEHLSNGVVPFKPLEVYLFNNDEYHHAYNKSDENRFHIIAHAEYDYDFAELFVRSFEKYYEHSITPKQSA
tara:strand:+ start:883 stop:1578 length:696 start_codon:yes stop_codon:yes gene_type:complete